MKKNKQYDQSEIKLAKAGLTTHKVGFIFRNFEEYLEMPKFGETTGKYKLRHLENIKKFLWTTTDSKEAHNKIQQCISYLFEEGFTDLNYEDFKITLKNAKLSPMDKIKDLLSSLKKIGSSELEKKHKVVEEIAMNSFYLENQTLKDEVINLVAKTSKFDKKNLKKFFHTTFSEMKEGIVDITDIKKDYLIDQRFKIPNLIENIWSELDKKHKLDHNEKIASFLIAVSAELKEEGDHISAAFKGYSSTGKDNIIKTVLELFDEKDNFFLTNATVSSLEEQASRVKRIAFSELNKHREGGANKHLTETYKQLAEGGLISAKKDVNTNFKTTKITKIGQKTLLYGTTESESDEELETRHIIIPIKGYPAKNKIVVNDTLDKTSSPEKWIANQVKRNNWIARSISNLCSDLIIIIPYAHLLKEPIETEKGNKKHFFDYSKDRIKRDAKRLLSITKSITWLYQKQRISKTIGEYRFLYSEPSDFLLAIRICADFFNLTYSGLDHRHEKTLNKIKEIEGKHAKERIMEKFTEEYRTWVLRNLLQQELGISINTIKKHIKILADKGFIDTYYDPKVTTKAYLVRPINVPIKKVSLPISLETIDRCLTDWVISEKFYQKQGKTKIEPIPLEFIDKLEKESKNHQKMTCQGLTYQNNLEKKEKSNPENLSDIKEGSIKHLIQTLESQQGSCNALLIDQTFDQKLINKAFKEGIIAEYKKGIYSLVK